MEQTKAKFDPTPHLMKMPKGGKEYLLAAARIAWFRSEHPITDGWRIEAKLIDGGIKEGFAVFQAEIRDPEGNLVQTGLKQECKTDFADFMEKAETGSIARAVSMCGFGILQAQEFDEGERIVDTPQPARQQGAGRPANTAAKTERPAASTKPATGPEGDPPPAEEPPPTDEPTSESAAPAGDVTCAVCGAAVGSNKSFSPGRVNWCKAKNLPAHCSTCSLPEAS